MKIRPTKAQRDAALSVARHAIEQRITLSAANLSADGGATVGISDEERDVLLAKCARGEYVRLVADNVLAYEHMPDEPNRRFVQIRDGQVLAAARTAEGRPFLKNHDQEDVDARGGTILESRGVRRGDGDYAIVQKIELTAPWAVEMALRGLLTFVSIGMRLTGPVLCSYCNAEIFTECCHCPGEEVMGADPKADPVRIVWVFTSVEIVETSAVNVPAVPGAHIEGIRAALSAALGGSPPEGNEMNFRLLLLSMLSLGATATDEEIDLAVKERGKKLDSLAAELSIANGDLTKVTAERDALKSAKLAADAESFIDTAINLGQIAPSDKESWSALYAADEKKAVELMAKRKPNAATPVGSQRQTATTVASGTETPSTETLSGAITGGEPVATARLKFFPRVKAQLAASLSALSANPRAMDFAVQAFGFDGKGQIKVPTTLGATSINNNGDLDAAKIGYRAAMLEAVVGEPDPCMQVATEVTSNRATESYKWLGDLPAMEEWKNDRIMAQLEAYQWAITNKKWQATLRVKNDDFRDDNLGLLPSHVAGMGEQARLQPALLIAHLLLNGFAGTAFPDIGDGLAFDGAFFFDTSHATGSNKLALPFSADALEQAIILLRKQKRFDLKSNLYARGTHLIVGVDNERAAEKVMTAEYLVNAAGGTGTGSGVESNTLKGKFKVIVTPEFQNGEWCLADLSGSVKPVLFQNREGITTTTVGGRAGMQEGGSDMVGFMYDETWFGAETRNNAGYWDFRRIVGSKP